MVAKRAASARDYTARRTGVPRERRTILPGVLPLPQELPWVFTGWAIAWLALEWPRMRPETRRWLALSCSAAGLVCLILALGAEGEAQADSRSVFLYGASYVTEHASAAASVTLYTLCAFWLLVGTTALGLPERWLRVLRQRPVLVAFLWSLAVTALRFALEKAAAPPPIARAAGVTWLPPIVGLHLWLRRPGPGIAPLAARLYLYGLSTRAVVAAVVAAATLLGLGTHYDLSALTRVTDPVSGTELRFESGSAAQVLRLGIAPQLVFWPLYTVLAGLLGAGLAGLARPMRSLFRPTRP